MTNSPRERWQNKKHPRRVLEYVWSAARVDFYTKFIAKTAKVISFSTGTPQVVLERVSADADPSWNFCLAHLQSGNAHHQVVSKLVFSKLVFFTWHKRNFPKTRKKSWWALTPAMKTFIYVSSSMLCPFSRFSQCFAMASVPVTVVAVLFKWKDHLPSSF